MAKDTEVVEQNKPDGRDEKTWQLVNIKLESDEIEELKRRAGLNCRAFTAEATYIVKLVIGGRGKAVTVPGVDELRLVFGKEA